MVFRVCRELFETVSVRRGRGQHRSFLLEPITSRCKESFLNLVKTAGISLQGSRAALKLRSSGAQAAPKRRPSCAKAAPKLRPSFLIQIAFLGVEHAILQFLACIFLVLKAYCL